MMKVLIANRGEIAARIIRSSEEMGIPTVSVYSDDDAKSLHTLLSSKAVSLDGTGPGAYLDIDRMMTIAVQNDCTAIHPGYGLLSENSAFASRCAREGLIFIGPDAGTLSFLGNKTEAKALAEKCGIPVLQGLPGPVSLEQVTDFFQSLDGGAPIIIKAVSGGGGLGMRVVHTAEEIESAYLRCESEAQNAFGNGALYVEAYMPFARHIEVQIVGDGTGAVSHLWERECSLQRNRQKLVEMAPGFNLPAELLNHLYADAVRLGKELKYRNLGTVEFLVHPDPVNTQMSYAFIEANARLQVEHTVTEEITDLDLIRVQLQIASGATLKEIGLEQSDIPAPRTCAMQVRINMETPNSDGTTTPASGTLSDFMPPSGNGIRTDTHGYPGYSSNPNFDSLLAKLICRSTSMQLEELVKKTYRALCEFKIAGVKTNIPFLQNLLLHPDIIAGRFHIRFVEKNIATLAARPSQEHKALFFTPSAAKADTGTKIDASDPLAILEYGKKQDGVSAESLQHFLDSLEEEQMDEGVIRSYMQGTIISLNIKTGDMVQKGEPLMVMGAMKMEHVISAPVSGKILELLVNMGDMVPEKEPLVIIEEIRGNDTRQTNEAEADPEFIRSDLSELMDRQNLLLDSSRPRAVEKRHKNNQRTARENVSDLCDEDSFIEYGGFVVAAQKGRRSMDDLTRNTPADGMIAGTAQVNGHLFPKNKTRCVVCAYDFTVLSGTQGMWNHYKKDRMFELAEKYRIPVFVFTEGGGGRPGDVDACYITALNCRAFHLFGKLSGLVPLVGINSGKCFAGNAVLLGCCDVVIATKDSNIGLGGPAMVEGGGLGAFRPEDIGPAHVQVPNGAIDIIAEDEAEAVRHAKKYISYFQGSLDNWECADQRQLRHVIPENRVRVYSIRKAIELIADTGSVLELRRYFGLGMITAFIRIEGRPIGVIANNPRHLSGAIDAPGADKSARFMKLCDAFGIPVLFLCDTPGFMVGPENEKTAMVRHAGRLFVNGANLSVPYITLVLRKGYGLGAQTMAGGSFHAPLVTLAWPTGEFGAMGVEGFVKLGFRKEIAAIEDPEERTAFYQQLVDKEYEKGKAINLAAHFEIDGVIDPADSRKAIINALDSAPPIPERKHKKYPSVDTW